MQVIGTWDDHDYGLNDAGKEFSGKNMTQKLLLDFLDEAPDSPRWETLRQPIKSFIFFSFSPPFLDGTDYVIKPVINYLTITLDKIPRSWPEGFNKDRDLV